nr:mucin-5AC-like [Procambarus clarkii]
MPPRRRGYGIYSGTTKSGESKHPEPEDTEDEEQGRNTFTVEAADTGTAGGVCCGGNTSSDKAGDTEETAVDSRGGKTADDEIGNRGGGTEPSERAAFFSTTTRLPHSPSTSLRGNNPHEEPEPSDVGDAPEARATSSTPAPTPTAGATPGPTPSTGTTPAPDAPSSHSTYE